VKSEIGKQQDLALRLYVYEDNRAAIKAYEKSGFVHSKYKIMTLSQLAQ